jgi:hypothetical protein
MSLQADSASFVSEAVNMGKKGQKLTLTFSVEGLPAGTNPVVGVFDKQGKIVGRTEWQSNTSSPTFAKKFVIMHANSTQLTFSVYNAGDNVSKDDYIGGCTADLKNLMGNGGKNDVTEDGITFHFNVEAPKKNEKSKPKKEEKKSDPVADAAARKKLIAKCDKEGGKKAQDLAGMRDMGGVAYFHVSIDTCQADWELLEACMVAMNKPCPEDADERRGGAEDIGKVLISYIDEKLALYMHVPSNLECDMNEWFSAMTDGYTVNKIFSDKVYIKAEIKADPDANVFPIKVKDDVINKGYQMLTLKKLVMPDEDSDDELVFGDDDFYI